MAWWLLVAAAVAVLLAIVVGLMASKKHKKYPPQSKYVSNERIEGETPPRRSVHREELVEHFERQGWADVRTLTQLLEKCGQAYADNNCLGWREVVKIHTEKREVTKNVGGEQQKQSVDWKLEEKSAYKWLTYAEVLERVKQLTNGLLELGLKGDSRFGLYCGTRPEWFLLAHACIRTNITAVTVYPNLGEDGLVHALEQGKLEYMFTSGDLLGMVGKLLPELKSLRGVIYIDEAKDADVDKIRDADIRVLSYDELFELGAGCEHEHTPPERDDLAVIMYTSGTTGPPKGVMLTHRNLVSCIAAVAIAVDVRPADVYIGYLPLAHVLELIVENCLLSFGASIGYANHRTLTQDSVKNCKGDIAELRPTLMAGVPFIWEKIRKGALGKINSSSPVVRATFRAAYKLRGAQPPSAIDALLDALVFKKFKQQLGGRMRLILSGGAALSKETQEFMSRCFGIPVLQGYGLTETCGGSCLVPPDVPKTGVGGAPLPCVEIKLVDVPEMQYFAHSDPPQGEIWIRGPSVSQGYYKMPEKTKEDFHEDGWFATGDIGEWTEEGLLAIIDRKKNLVKMSHGEYIALEKLETKYKDSLFANLVCVYGDSDRDYPIALVQPNEKELTQWADKHGVPYDDFEDLCQNEEAKAKVLDSLKQVAKQNDFKQIEVVRAVVLCPEQWTAENGLLTAALKLKRGDLVEKYRAEIEDAYGSGGGASSGKKRKGKDKKSE